MLDLGEVTTLLTSNGINAVASKLKVKKADVYTFLKSNGLKYADGVVVPIIGENKGTITKVIPKDIHKESREVIRKDNKSLDIEKLRELIEMIEPLKAVIKEYDQSKNIIEIDKIELKPPSVTEVKQKLFKVDSDILDNWTKFVAEHKEFKVQSLISLALDEFVKKYGK